MQNYTPVDIKNEGKRGKFDKYLILTLLLILFHTIGNIIWIYLNKVQPTWDQSLHIVYSIKMLDYLKENFFNFNLVDFLRISRYYPPFVYWIGMIFALISSYSYKVIMLSGSLFFALSIIFAYLYTNILFKNKRIAFFSAFFFSFFLVIFEQSRYQMLDIPLTALVISGLFYLEKSEKLSNRKNTFIFFTLLGLSILTKWYSLPFFFIPLLLIFVGFIKKRPNKNIIFNILIGICLILIFVLPWYLINFDFLSAMGQITITPEKADPSSLLSAQNIFFYLKLIIMFQLSFIGSIFLFFSGLWLLKYKEKSIKTLIFLTILFNYVFFTFVGNKNIRVLFPIMPFLAMIMAYGINFLLDKKRNTCIFIASIIFLWYIFSYFILSFGVPIYPKYKYAINFPLIGWIDVYYFHYYPIRAIYQDMKFPYEQVLTDIYNLKKDKINLLMLVDTEYINQGSLDPYHYQKFRLKANNIDYVTYNSLESKITDKQINDFLVKEVDVILVPKINIGLIEGIREYDSLLRFKNYIFSKKNVNFSEVNKYYFSGNEFFPPDTYILYKKSSL